MKAKAKLKVKRTKTIMHSFWRNVDRQLQYNKEEEAMQKASFLAVFLFAAVAVCVNAAAGVHPSMASATPPIVAFRPTGDRSLIAVNNPEQLWTYDFADKYNYFNFTLFQLFYQISYVFMS